jgi:type II secretory pathway predicted ATPase ExeA
MPSTGFSVAGALQNAAPLLARHVTAARPAFAAVFDPLAGGIRAVQYVDFKLLALGADNQEQALERAFQYAEETGFLEPLLHGLLAMGGLDMEACLRAARPRQLAATPATRAPQGQTLTLEAWSQDMPDWIRMSDLSAGLMLARSRLCLIQVATERGVARGTGFLIGPQTVLTNFHVIQSLIDPQTGRALPDTARRISCHFEHGLGAGKETCQAVDDWLVAYSPMRPDALSAHDPYRDTPNPFAAEVPLDFCALRLLNAPGRRRGWYDLRDTGSIHHERDITFVVQHPADAEQHVGFGTGSRAFAAGSPYMEHHAPTATGSSGGLCLDHRLKPLALHYGAERDAAGTLRRNCATFLHRIVAVAPDIDQVQPAHDWLWRLDPLDGRLVIGRRATQQRVLHMVQNAERPILVIRGGTGSGKSFSCQIIRACMARDRVALVPLSARTLPTSAHQLAVEILTHAGVPPAAIATLPAGRPTDTSLAAWLHTQFLPQFQTLLHTHLHPMQRQLWLVLDDLEHIDIPQTDARELLDALYAAAPQMPCLRIVLIGLRQQPIGIDPDRVQLETLPAADSISLQELVDSLCALFTEHRIGVPMEEVTRHAQLALSLAQSLPWHGDWGGLATSHVPASPLTLLGRLSQLLQAVHAKVVPQWQN